MNTMRACVAVVLLLLLLLAACGSAQGLADPSSSSSSPYIVPPALHVKAAAYPDWAHHHWVWLDHGGNGQADCLQLAHDYVAHNITIGAVDIDSTWETGFNNFIPNTDKFPNMTAMIDEFHAMGLRVIFWITNMIDEDSSNYKEGLDNDYYIKNIFGKAGVVKWWHGKGSMIDYTNPSALKWWHAQMDNMLDLGIDGWKCDGTDPYINEFIEPKAFNGSITWREYANLYYGDFFDYTRQRLGNDRLIMSRPVDAYGPLFVRFSPKRVMISGWVGDQDDTFDGLKGALKRYFQSAWDGYANFGSDIGGYRTPQKPRQPHLFIRWAQVGAFSPLMENGGGGEHRPWMIDPDNALNITSIYRNFVDVHYSLNPYLLSAGSAALENGTSVLHPLAAHESWINKAIDLFNPDSYCYLLGDSILVAPVLDNGTVADVKMPKDGSLWTGFFNPSISLKGNGQRLKLDTQLNEMTVLMKNGHIIPLNLTKELNGLPAADGFLSAVIYGPAEGHTVHVRTNDYSPSRGLGHELSYTRLSPESIVLESSAHTTTSVAWVLVNVPAPAPIEDSNFIVAYNQATSVLQIKVKDNTKGARVEVRWH